MSASPEFTQAPHGFSQWHIRVSKTRVSESHAVKKPPASPSSSPSQKKNLIDNNACHTPESKECRIPIISGSCPPPAPKKPRRMTVLCKRRLSELEVFKIEGEELEKLFVPHSVKKQKKQAIHDDDH